MLILDKITLSVAGRTLIENSSINIPQKSKVGFLGRNGAGKSSLFQSIYGQSTLQQGNIIYPKNAKIGWVKQEIAIGNNSLIDTLLSEDTQRSTLLQLLETCSDANEIAHIYERLNDIEAHSAPARAQTILSGLGFNETQQNMPIESFSGGMRMRVALAASLFTRPDILLLDEPSNYLDLEGVMWLEQYIKHFKGTVILISHDRDLLNNCVNRILNLDNKKLSLWSGNYDDYIRLRTEKVNFEQKQLKAQNDKRKKIESFIERFRYISSKATQAQSRIKTLEKLQQFETYRTEATPPFFFNENVKKLASPLIKIENTILGYEGKVILKDLNLRIDNDDRIALLGKNGNGKSTFAKFLAQKLQAFSGERTQNPKLSVAYFEQHNIKSLNLEHNAVQHVAKILPNLSEAKSRSLIAQWGLNSEKALTISKNLSGGEKTRLAMGLATAKGADLLILDEPTNHLDIDSRQELILALNSFNGAIILISHDQYLLESTIDKLWQVKNGTIEPYLNTIHQYKQEILQPKNKPIKASKENTRIINAQKRNNLSNLKKEITKLETILEKLQKESNKLSATLCDSATYEKEASFITSLNIQKAELDKKIIETENLWLKYSDEYEKNYNAQ